MKASKKLLAESPGSGLRKILGLIRKRGIMSWEQGMLKFEGLNIIVQYFLFDGRYGRRIMNKEQGMLKFEMLNVFVRYFLFYERYGILNRKDTKARRHRENRVSMISMIPAKSYIRNRVRNLFFLFMELFPGEINMMRRNPQAMGGCYKWTRDKWLNLTESHNRGNKENALALPGGKSRSNPPLQTYTADISSQTFLRHQIFLREPIAALYRKVSCKLKANRAQLFQSPLKFHF